MVALESQPLVPRRARRCISQCALAFLLVQSTGTVADACGRDGVSIISLAFACPLPGTFGRPALSATPGRLHGARTSSVLTTHMQTDGRSMDGRLEKDTGIRLDEFPVYTLPDRKPSLRLLMTSCVNMPPKGSEAIPLEARLLSVRKKLQEERESKNPAKPAPTSGTHSLQSLSAQEERESKNPAKPVPTSGTHYMQTLSAGDFQRRTTRSYLTWIQRELETKQDVLLPSPEQPDEIFAAADDRQRGVTAGDHSVVEQSSVRAPARTGSTWTAVRSMSKRLVHSLAVLGGVR
jgi:hypothetical protein